MRSLRIGKYFGIGVYIHWTFWLLPMLLVILHLAGRLPDLTFHFCWLAVLFVCVVLHEYGHALTARLFGIGTRDITLCPIGGIARLENMSEDPVEEFWIAVAGPAVNIVIAALLALALAVWSLFVPPAQLIHSVVARFVAGMVGVNIALVLFNMLPAFPMDGGRVFRAVLSLWLDRLEATRIAVGVGTAVALFFGVGMFLMTFSPLILLVAFFVIVVGRMELRYLEWKKYADEEAQQQQSLHSYDQAARYAANDARGAGVNGDMKMQPNIAIWTWDNRTGAWVKENPNPAP